MWTNTSLPPLSGWMKPNPFVALNHLTVPVAIIFILVSQRESALDHARGVCPTPATCLRARAVFLPVEAFPPAAGCPPPGAPAIKGASESDFDSGAVPAFRSMELG